MNIVLCDDDNNALKILDHKIRNFLDRNKISYKIMHFISGEKLLHSNISLVDIIFLDVRLAEKNGIQIAAALRKRNSHFVLIFVSSFLEYAPNGYSVNATRYVLKEQLDLCFEEAMNSALRELGYFRTLLTFEFVDGAASIYTDNIVYIESDLHKVHFHFSGNHEMRHLYGTLNSIQRQLPSNEFIRIHQSFIVNFSYFIDAKNYCAKLIDNITLPISQRRAVDVKKQLYLFRGRI